MKFEIILHNDQGACFSEKVNSRQECQEFLESFSDPENFVDGRVIDNETGEELAILSWQGEFVWKNPKTCQKGLDASWEDCRECSFSNYGLNCNNDKIPDKTDFTSMFSSLK